MKRLFTNNKVLPTLAVVAALSFFIGYRFFIANELWKGRDLPPEPDDSFTYISAARDIETQGTAIPDTVAIPKTSSERAKSLPYSILLVALSKTTGLSVEDVYQVTFYLGSVIAAFVFFVFLRYLFRDDLKASLGLATVTLFTGHGGYHGFFWVVPSFFSLLSLTFLLYILLAPSRRTLLLLGLTVPFFILVHPFSLYASSIFVLFVVLSSLFEQRVDRVLAIRVVMVMVFVVVTTLAFGMFQRTQHIGEGPTADLPSVVSQLATSRTVINVDAWRAIQSLYLGPLVPSLAGTSSNTSANYGWIALGPLFMIGALVLARRRSWKVLSWYGASLVFTVAATLTEFAGRTLLFLWPPTFVIASVALWSLARKTPPQFRALRAIVLALVALLLLEVPGNGLEIVRSFNGKAKVEYRRDALDFLRQQTSPRERILFADKFSETYFIRGGGLTDRAPVLLPSVDWTDPNAVNEGLIGSLRFIVATDSTLQQYGYEIQLSSFFRAYYRFHQKVEAPGVWYNRHLVELFDAGDTKAFGHLRIYRIGNQLTEDDFIQID